MSPGPISTGYDLHTANKRAAAPSWGQQASRVAPVTTCAGIAVDRTSTATAPSQTLVGGAYFIGSHDLGHFAPLDQAQPTEASRLRTMQVADTGKCEPAIERATRTALMIQVRRVVRDNTELESLIEHLLLTAMKHGTNVPSHSGDLVLVTPGKGYRPVTSSSGNTRVQQRGQRMIRPTCLAATTAPR